MEWVCLRFQCSEIFLVVVQMELRRVAKVGACGRGLRPYSSLNLDWRHWDGFEQIKMGSWTCFRKAYLVDM